MEAIEFSYTQEDFTQAQRLHHTVSLRGRRFLVLIGLVSCGVGLLFATSLFGGNGNRLEYGLLGAAMFLCVMALLILANRVAFLPRASRRQFAQQKEFKGAVKIEICPPTIGVTSKNGFSNTPTEDFLKWSENRRVILLYRSERLFNFIPRRSVSDAFYASLKAELARGSVPKAGFSNS